MRWLVPCMLDKTQLHRYHVNHARMVEFAGFEMPIWYKGIIPETLAVRERVGIFDVSHMGRGLVEGPNAEPFLNFVTTNDVSSLKTGQAHYSLLCNERGGIKDDIIVLKLKSDRFVVGFNACNREKDVSWLKLNAERVDAEFTNISDQTALISLQGPKARSVFSSISSVDLSSISHFGCVQTKVNESNCLVSGTGYTGEEGFEVLVWDSPITSPEKAENIWSSMLDSGREFGIEPCGLGSRDVLRLEAGMCLYGDDIDESTSPYEARLGFTVRLTKTHFVGKGALLRQKSEVTRRLRVGLAVTSLGIPRAGYEIVKETKTLGKLTSGTYSPTLNRGIGMGYVPREYANHDEKLGIMTRGRVLESVVVKKFPFYPTDKYGWQRKT